MKGKRMVRRASLLIAIILGLASASFAESPRKGLFLDQGLQASYNSLGVQLATKLFYRQPLAMGSGILWESAKVELGAKNSLSPAYDLIGAYVDIEPIAVFDLELSAQFAGYFDALGYGFHDLAGYDSSFDSSALDKLEAKNATGFILSAAPTFKIAFGPIAVLDTLNAHYFRVDGGSGYFYEAMGNCVLAKNGVELFNDAYALWRFPFGLMAGLNDSVLYVPDSGYTSHTLQAVGVYTRTFSEKLDFYAALMAGIYLADRYYDHYLHAAGQVGITLAL
jgi:hypothetical protein